MVGQKREIAHLVDYPAYEFHRDGTVRRVVQGTRGTSNPRNMRVHHRGGYLRIRLNDRAGHRRTCAVHRLICRAFHGEPVGDRCFVRHLDDDPANNAANNLAWGSKHENERDKKRFISTLDKT